MGLRVIFDRSSFHGERFVALAESPLRRLARTNRISVFHTPVFIEETVATSASKKPEAKSWQQHLKFLVEICNGGIFLGKEEIWFDELIAGRGRYARYLMPKRKSRRYNSEARLLETLAEKAESGDMSEELEGTKKEREVTERKKDNQRAIAADMRKIVINAIKAKQVKGALGEYPFSHMRDSEFLRMGTAMMGVVDERRSGALAATWARDPMRYPFYSSFIEGVLYAGYYAATKHNEPLDRNAQNDYEQLAYLNWADVVVSNDETFFRQAFEDIWLPRGKRIETAETFVQLLHRLA